MQSKLCTIGRRVTDAQQVGFYILLYLVELCTSDMRLKEALLRGDIAVCGGVDGCVHPNAGGTECRPRMSLPLSFEVDLLG